MISLILVLCEVCIEAAKAVERQPYDVIEIGYFL
jgi:hypothetical protein